MFNLYFILDNLFFWGGDIPYARWQADLYPVKGN